MYKTKSESLYLDLLHLAEFAHHRKLNWHHREKRFVVRNKSLRSLPVEKRIKEYLFWRYPFKFFLVLIFSVGTFPAFVADGSS